MPKRFVRDRCPTRTAAALACAAVALQAAPAAARAVQDERYATEQTWNAALRLLRVDFGFAITERDRDAGFILFSYQDAGRSTAALYNFRPGFFNDAQRENVRLIEEGRGPSGSSGAARTRSSTAACSEADRCSPRSR